MLLPCTRRSAAEHLIRPRSWLEREQLLAGSYETDKVLEKLIIRRGTFLFTSPQTAVSIGKSMRQLLLGARSMILHARVRRNQQVDPDCGPMKSAADFTDVNFFKNFRFRRPHFYRIMQNLEWDDKDFTNMGASRVRATREWCLLAVLHRFSTGGTNRAIAKTVGGNDVRVSLAIDRVTRLLEESHGAILEDMRAFTPDFPRFAAYYKKHKVPLENLVGFVDGHQLSTCRPGGLGCVYDNFDQAALYSFKTKGWSLLFQTIVFPCGQAVVHGPFVGRRSDPFVWSSSGCEDILQEVDERGGGRFRIFGDRIYHLSNYLQRPFKQSKNHPLNSDQKYYNQDMAKARIHVEQWFAGLRQTFAFFRDPTQLAVGRSPVGRWFRTACTLFNWRSSLYGNLVSAAWGKPGNRHPGLDVGKGYDLESVMAV